MFLTLVDAIFLCAFYGVIAYCFAPFVLKQDTTYLNLSIWALAPIGGRFVVRLIIAKVVSNISYQIEGAVREELVLKLMRVGPLSYAIKGSLSTLFVDALDDIMPYFTSFLIALRYAMVIPVVCLVAVALVSPWSALILFLMAPLIPVFMIMIGRGAERLNQRQWLQITRLAVRFHEALDKLSLLKLFNIERSEIEKIARLTKRWRVETMQVLRIAFLSALVLEFFSTCGVALCAIFLGFAVYEKGFDYTTALFVLLIAPEFFIPLRQLGANYHARMKAIGAMANLTELLSEKDIFKVTNDDLCAASATADATATAAAGSAATAATAATAGTASSSSDAVSAAGEATAAEAPAWLKAPFKIDLQKVTAIYPNGRTGMKDVSALIEPNTITALTGPSGVGKSTLLQTIAGFTHKEAGDILVNGHACEREDLLMLMRHISYIPQLPNLFYGTLRDNLKIGAPHASDEELKSALQTVGAEELLTRFKDGLDHHVGNQNRGISGGEARLIALARALVRDSAILLLDEPTASLDRDSENSFLEALSKIAHNKTVVIVAHRRELIDFASKVIELKPNPELMAENQQANEDQNQASAASAKAASEAATAAKAASAPAGSAGEEADAVSNDAANAASDANLDVKSSKE